ncbi:reprolysin-like metallopeptidase [Hanstruepera ponticola]|uniref:reprolysin-like metallopeptidase n=1 Tax=Hanstruepera ponticola TaxID=2042995 RepID=UPI001F1F4473|nr:immunoglobulin-like domain-containing protein [Hanstruepera ponticola]
MKKTLLFILLMSTGFVFSQNKSFWKKEAVKTSTSIKESKQALPKNQTFSLDVNGLKQALNHSPKRNEFSRQSNVILSFPNSQGVMERFRIIEASNLHPDLQVRYPDIRSYAGQGIDDPSAVIRFSMSSLGFQSMRLSANGPATFIESISEDGELYAVFTRAERINIQDQFECEISESLNQQITESSMMRNADDSILRTYRLAVSATGEYTQYHGGTKAQALAAINNTMTRVNGIFEVDFNVTMVLIANTDDVIYTSTSSDPYGNTTSGYNSALQNTLTSVIGESNYDIGHLFANLQNNGNAGCIGCVCVNGQKGSGWTSASVPDGDFFDVDYVAHEMGHQFGANHTWTFNGNEGTNVQVEPGSGSTIMSYAGITGATDVQNNVHPNFHAVSIEQVTDYIKSTSCQTNTNTGNNVPTVSAGANYTIPKGTAFVLEGSASDADSGDVLSYSWEQMDENNASTTYPSTTATSGVAFRAYEPTTDNKRYFPRLSTIKSGATSWQWEAVPNVARTLNFRLTVRDNVAGGGTNNSDDMVVTVNGTAGPFVVNSPNSNVTWNAGSTQTVTWDVAGTTGNGVNTANVDIFLSTDGGDTYPIALAAGVLNDGSQEILVPNNQGTQNRIMVRGSNNIFFDISNSNFTIAGQVVCNAIVPTGLNASGITDSAATLTWDAVAGATYDLQYREVGSSSWTTVNVTGVSTQVSGLSPLTQYEAQVRSACPDTSTSAYSSIINFTTTDVQLNYCNSASTNINDEYIGRVQLNTIDNSSGGQFYTDFTSISTTLTKDTQYIITITPTWTGTVYSEGYAVWIDYNRDGDFDDASEQVWSQSATQTTPVNGSFTIPSNAVENVTRMRVSMKYNGVPTSCETFQYGEVEDYTVIIEGSGPDTAPPVITLNGASTIDLELGETYTELGATATDNVDGDISANIVIGGDTVDSNTVGIYVVTYNVSDTAGNNAVEVSRTVNVNPDTTAPVISLNGFSTVNLTVGDSYSELGATATDNLDGDISANIVVGGDTVDANTAGTYVITYNVSDSSGNAADEVIRTVNVSEPSNGCSGGINSFPYSESFENTLGAWTQSSADDIDWTVDANGTPSSNTGPSSAADGTYYVYVEASSPNYPSVRAILNSPCFNLSGMTEATFSFSYHMYGASDMGSIDLEISDDDGANWTSIWTQTGNQGNTWLDVDVSLNAYVGKGIQLRFNRFIGSTWQADIAIDNVSVAGPPAPDTQAPTAATLSASNTTETTTDLSWSGATDNVGVTDYDVYQDGSFIANVTGTTYQVTGLSESISYTFYVIANDAASNSSPASNTTIVTTLAAPTCNDGIQNGDETGVDCGGSSCVPCQVSDVVLNEGYFETGWDGWADGGSDCARYSGSNSYEGSYSIRIRDNSGTASAMTLSNIDISPFSQVVIDFYFYVNSMENGEDFWVRYYNGSTWTTVATYVSGSGISNGTFYNATVTLTPAQYTFVSNAGFRFQCDASGNNDQIYIDQVTITGTNSGRGDINHLIAIKTMETEDAFGDQEILVYPNPVYGNVLNVKLPGNQDASYSIVNILGQTVSKGNSISIVDVSALEAGVYFIKVNEGEEVITKKFIKQ